MQITFNVDSDLITEAVYELIVAGEKLTKGNVTAQIKELVLNDGVRHFNYREHEADEYEQALVVAPDMFPEFFQTI